MMKPIASRGWLQRIPSEWPGEVYLFPVRGFPVPEAERPELRRILNELTGDLAKEGFAEHLFVQLAQLHRGDAAARFSAQAPAWKPKMGFGVFPNRKPPSGWTREDFTELGPDERPRTLMNQVFEIAKPEARAEAWESLFGLGTIAAVFTRDDSKTLLKKTTEVLLPPIVDAAFRSFPYYFPLLDAASFGGDGPTIDSWLCGGAVYVRESVEDSGVLLASPAASGRFL